MSKTEVKKITSRAAVLINPTQLNVIVGRNGSGKSTYLRELATIEEGDANYRASYLSPERAGAFVFDPGIENSLLHDARYVTNDRKKNQSGNFKSVSQLRLRQLAANWAIRLDSDRDLRADDSRTFDSEYLAHINKMLSNVVLRRNNQGEFLFFSVDEKTIHPSQLSSGESEIVSLASEVMHFFTFCEISKTNFLILDEPDVHLHPDLQAKFAQFLVSQINGLSSEVRERVYVILATHSTPMICDLALSTYCSIGTKAQGVSVVEQRPVAEAFKSVAPFFGHPLSRFIGGDLPLIVEGDDDVRVWNQACRTSQGAIRLFPCLAKSKPELNALEKTCSNLMKALYDNPSAISFRDGDGGRLTLDPEGCVDRYALQCYEVENLLLTDECLQAMNTDWHGFCSMAKEWISHNLAHKDASLLQQVISSPDRARHKKIKAIRNLITGITDTKKDWEIVVGQAIGRLPGSSASDLGEFSIWQFIGINALAAIGVLYKSGEPEQDEEAVSTPP